MASSKSQFLCSLVLQFSFSRALKVLSIVSDRMWRIGWLGDELYEDVKLFFANVMSTNGKSKPIINFEIDIEFHLEIIEILNKGSYFANALLQRFPVGCGD